MHMRLFDETAINKYNIIKALRNIYKKNNLEDIEVGFSDALDNLPKDLRTKVLHEFKDFMYNCITLQTKLDLLQSAISGNSISPQEKQSRQFLEPEIKKTADEINKNIEQLDDYFSTAQAKSSKKSKKIGFCELGGMVGAALGAAVGGFLGGPIGCIVAGILAGIVGTLIGAFVDSYKERSKQKRTEEGSKFLKNVAENFKQVVDTRLKFVENTLRSTPTPQAA